MNDSIKIDIRMLLRNGKGEGERENGYISSLLKTLPLLPMNKSEIPRCAFGIPTSSCPCLPPWPRTLQLSLLQPPRRGTGFFLFFKQVRVFLSSRPLSLIISLCEAFFWPRISQSLIPILLFFRNNRTLAQLTAAQKRNQKPHFRFLLQLGMPMWLHSSQKEVGRRGGKLLNSVPL